MQLPLRDVNSFGCHVCAGGYHSSQRGEGHRCVEEAGLGEPRTFRGGHERLEEGGKQKKDQQLFRRFIKDMLLIPDDMVTCSSFYFESSECMLGELLL